MYKIVSFCEFDKEEERDEKFEAFLTEFNIEAVSGMTLSEKYGLLEQYFESKEYTGPDWEKESILDDYKLLKKVA